MTARPIAGRFAPSPTGRMHLGNVYAALLSYLSAKSQGGEWVLRIEDLDRGRCRPEYVDQLKEDLMFLGLEWDRGGDGLYLQSARSHIYEQELRRLGPLYASGREGLLYPCWCTRAELLANGAPHESDGRSIYPGTCRDNADRIREHKGKPAATRIRVPDREIRFTDRHYGAQCINLAEQCGDFILRRSDGSWAYQFAVVVDDAMMGITEVVRGRDLLLSAAQQLYLSEMLGYCKTTEFIGAPEYSHFPLLCNEAGQRLSKRDRSLDMGELRKNLSAAEIIGRLGYYAGLLEKEEPCTVAELISEFSWDRVPVEDIIIR